eukprot:CAMPEP_0175097152 /NCGR_PEP_ID=MMETSP0086_2-20121207/5127_1 /TAXON_ID=136419 /ORGANISM="Unknown Unknown, Strain D1" /LENGTH=161 /DNA_ID=CAMNT_0016370629 /DNA_START=82 /DNA_END=567 /DNA_ORIENTATION=-
MTILDSANFQWVVDKNICISGACTPEQAKLMAKEGVKSVLFLRTDSEEGVDTANIEKMYAEQLKLNFAHIPVAASKLSPELADRCVKAAASLPQPLLIQCQSATRAGAVLLLFLVSQGMKPSDAHALAETAKLEFPKKPPLQKWVGEYLSSKSPAKQSAEE